MSKIDINQLEAATEFTVSGPVTICPPGQRSKEIAMRAPIQGGPPVSTATSLSWPQKPSSGLAKPPRYNSAVEADKQISAAQRREAQAVALAQPHRAGFKNPDDPRLAFPLGRFCARIWARDDTFADAMHAAGVCYATEVRMVKVARGFHVEGGESDIQIGADDGGEDPTPEEISDQQAAIYGLERTLERADDLLRAIMPRCPSAMVALCFRHEEPVPYNEGILRDGLYALALHYSTWDPAKH